jgi:hypothetical protein
MANMVKVKIIGIIFFLILLDVSYLLFDSEANSDLRFKEWHPDSTIYISDFMKSKPIVKWDEFDARISTRILIRKSENGVPFAYAAMDRFNSWYNKNNHSAALLKHEAYHANITSIGANMLNKKIINDNLSYNDVLKERDRIIQTIISMQKEYDTTTSHSLNKSLQNYWEYKIDSTLNSDIELNVIDEFSGATAYFPVQPEIFIQKDTFMLFKIFQLEKYEMKFRFIVKFDEYVDTTNYENNFVKLLTSLNFQSISSRKGYHDDMLMVETHCTDTVYKRIFHDRIIYDNNHEYQLTVFHPISTEGDSIYKVLTNRFFESFTLNNMTTFWEQKYLQSNTNETKNVTVAKGEQGDFKTFTSLPYSDYSITYHKPITVRNEIIIPFKSERHTLNHIDELLIIINDDKIYSQKVDSVNQIIHFNSGELKKSINKIQFGYIAKSDSINEVNHFYSSIVQQHKASSKH